MKAASRFDLHSVRFSFRTFGCLGLALFLALGSVSCSKAEKKSEEKKTGGGEVTAALAVKPVVVNLADQDPKYLRAALGLGSNQPKLQEEFEKNPVIQTQVYDTLISVLSAKKSEEILSADGKDKLKEEIKLALNNRLPDRPISDIYITEFLVQ